jgi:hypothetical protein
LYITYYTCELLITYCTCMSYYVLRICCNVSQQGDVAGCVHEIGALPPGANVELDGFVAEARKRLVVEQALRLIRAHVTTSLASLS